MSDRKQKNDYKSKKNKGKTYKIILRRNKTNKEPSNNHQEPPLPSSSSPSNNHQESPLPSLSSSPSNHHQPSNNNDIVKIGLIIVVIFALLYTGPTIRPLIIKPFITKPSLFQKFADITNNIFEEINSVKLPDVNTVMEHSVVCRRAANTIQRSQAFKSYGSDIAAGLRDFGETTKETGYLLREMSSKGSSIFTSFDIEIEAMMHRLNTNSRQGDARYVKERLNRLLTKIKDFRKLVEKAHNCILNVEEIRHQNEGNVEDGLREAEKYSNDEKYSGDIVKAKKELGLVHNILSQLHITAGQLEKLRIILENYEDKMRDVSDGLDNVGKDGTFEITKTDLKYLELAVDNSKASHYKFNNAQISD